MNNTTKYVLYTLGLLSVAGTSNLHAEEAFMIHSEGPKEQDQMQMPDTTMVPKAAEGSRMSDAVNQNLDLSTFIRLLNAADLSKELANQKEVTIFAPSNAAFEKISAKALDDLFKPENKDKLKALILYHIVPGKLMKADLKSGSLKTLNGEEVDIVVGNGQVSVDKANVVTGDLVGQNGVIHIIDEVNQP